MLPSRGAPQDCMNWWSGEVSIWRGQRLIASGQLPVTPSDSPVLWECSVKAQTLGKAAHPSAFSRHFLLDAVILLLQMWHQSTCLYGIRIKIIYGIPLCDNRSLETNSKQPYLAVSKFKQPHNWVFFKFKKWDALIEIYNCSHWEGWRQYS